MSSSTEQEMPQLSASYSNFGADLLGRLHQDVSKYMEVQQIFVKLEQNGFIKQMYDAFFNAMSHEYEFTVTELAKMQARQQETHPNQPFDFIDKYQQNSLIFKSNFQLVCSSISDYLWVLFFNKAQKEEIAKNPSSTSVDALNFSPIRSPGSSPQEVQLQPTQLQASTSFSTSPIQDHHHNNEQLFMQLSPPKNEIKRPTSGKKQPSQMDIPEDLQEKSKKFLVYDSKQMRQQIIPSPKGMSISNLQKNMKRVASNYPDLDKQINLLSNKERSRNENVARQQFPSKQGSVDSPLSTLLKRDSKDSLNLKGKGENQSETASGMSGSQGFRSQIGNESSEIQSRRHLFFDPTQPLLTNFVLSCQQQSQKLSKVATKELALAALQSTRSLANSISEEKESKVLGKQ